MPLTKQYLRYVAASRFGLVTSRKGDALLYAGPNSSLRGKRLVVCPALEDVIIWDLKTCSKVHILLYGLMIIEVNVYLGHNFIFSWYAKVAVLPGEGEVGVVCLSRDQSQLSVGREDGSVELWVTAPDNILAVKFK